ncbi:unnamed protein product [Rotaria sordida]|uniref:Uncharacterized protein n=1 Tax=Rotaria sordida TaxID=392033 RepID=A0A818RMA4_9BILA|nr:unnamed protein product [Rotaria sordida]
MSAAISVRIPDGKLGTVRVDRTVDVYPLSIINNENISIVKLYIPKLKLQRQLTATATPLSNTNSEEAHNYNPIIKSNNQKSSNDEDISDIAIIYSVVRRSSIRRTSSPRLSVLPLSTDFNITQPYIAKSYTLEPPSIPIVSHVSKQSQIKALSSTLSSATFLSISTSSSTKVSSSTHIQTSASFTKSDRSSIPSITIKPRPYSFRNTGRSALERQISNITERVTQLQETFFSRRSNTSNNGRNRSLSNCHSTVISTNTNESNTSNRRLIRPRPRSEAYDDHHRVCAAGSYAQLTLLGQPKVNSILQTQKTIPVDYQNGRVQYRTQTSNPERPHSTIGSNSFQTVFDTKKARDNYEKLLKQLEISKKEFDRQRSKGLNHNPARISQLEYQIKQYEQQLNKLKSYLDSIDISTDPSSNIHDDNRPHTFIESSTNRLSTQSHGSSGHKKQNSLPESTVLQVMTGISPSISVSSPLHHIKRKFQSGKTETYDLVKNWDSLNTIPTDEAFKRRESYENYDDNAHTLTSNVQSISSFDDIQQSIHTSNWIPLTIFLNFLLTDTNSDPSHLLFYILTEDLRIRKSDNRNELIRWIFEIHSTFTMNGSPLYIGLPQSQTDAINRWLDIHQQETTEDIKNIFNDAKDYAKSIIIDRQIVDFNHKRSININNDLYLKQNHFIEETLRSIFEYHYKSSYIDDWNSIKNARSLALICALATYLKRCDIKKCGNIPLEKIPKFLDKEQKRLLAKLQRTTPMKKIKDHQLNEHQFLNETLCQVCFKPLWGINYQGYLCGYCQQAYHRECAVNSEKCSKDRAKLRKFSNNRNPSIAIYYSLSGSVSADNLMQNLSVIPTSSTQSRGFVRRSVGGSSTLFHGFMTNINGPSRTTSMIEGREGSVPNDTSEMIPGSNEGIDPTDGNISTAEQNKTATVGRCSSDRRAAPDRPAAPKNRSSSNPQMGGNTIDELLNHRTDSDFINQQDSTNQQITSIRFSTSPSELIIQQTTDGDSDLEADVNTLPNLSEFIPNDVLQVLYQTREWKFQTTINELIHTERTHLKSLKIMVKCFREPMERFHGMSPVELDCIFRNLDQLIHLHTQFKYALRQHREEAKDHVVRNIGDLLLKFLDGDKGEEFARACAYFIEDQSQALKLIKKKEQSPDFASLMRICESNPLCRRLTLKDYLPCVMTRFTKYKMLFEAMKKFASEDHIESEKLNRCIECADNILKHMNGARLKKEQEALLKQIKSNLDIQIPNDEKLQNLQDCLEPTNNRLIYSGVLKLLPDSTTQKTEFECCLFNDIFVFFQKIPIQSLEQRGIEESYKYVLKEHQRDATSGRHQRPRTTLNPNKYPSGQNFILTPIIRLEHLLIKKKACGGARSFYVIDTDKKQLIEVEANSKDDLEKWLEWIEKARKPFEKTKSYPYSSKEKNLHSSSSTLTTQSTISEEQPNIQTIIPNEKATPESILNSIMTTDTEIKRLLHEKEMLLSRLLNIPQNTPNFSIHSMKPKTSLEAVTYATSYHNQLMQIINQIPNEIDKTIDIQSISIPLIKLGEQLTLTLKLLNQDLKDADNENNVVFRRNISSFNVTPSMNTDSSQTYSDLLTSSLHSSKSLSSVVNSYQQQPPPQQSSITNLDETVKSTPLQVARDIVERYDEGVFDDGAESQTEEEENNSVIVADSDDEDEIEHFDSSDCIITNIDNNPQQINDDYLINTKNNQNDRKNSSNTSIEGQTINLGNN